VRGRELDIPKWAKVNQLDKEFEDELKNQFSQIDRVSDAITGGLLYASYLIYPLLMVLLLLPCGYVYCRRQQAGYQYSRQVSLVKFTTLVLFVVLAVVINGVI
jgi:hypothetical protein